MLIGYLISSIYFYEIVVNYFKYKIDEEEFNSRFKNLLFFDAILASICCLLSPITLITPINKLDGIMVFNFTNFRLEMIYGIHYEKP